MKKLLFILIVSILYAACTGKKDSTEKTNESNVPYPYTAAYSSKFSLGKASSALNVLNSYKAWETGDMDAFKNTIGDSLTFYFSDGNKFIGSKDSAFFYAKRFRDSLAKVTIKIDAWVPLHTDDKNEDWVSVWYTEADMYKDGKVDSAYYQEDHMLDKNGKITLVYSHKQVLK